MSSYDPDGEDDEMKLSGFVIFAIVFSVLAFLFFVLRSLNILLNQP